MKINNRAQQLRSKNLALHNSVKKQVKQLAKVNNTTSVIYLYDVIDSDPYWGFTALNMAGLLTDANGSDIQLRINSPGGDVFEARAISTVLQQYPGKVDVFIDGLAASAATYIALAGDSVQMAEGAFFMIHNAWTYTAGDKNDFRSLADDLDKIDASIAADYGKKTGLDAEKITQWMDAETWFNAEESLENGFIDGILEPIKASTENSLTIDLSAFANSADKTVHINIPVIENTRENESITGVPDHIKRSAQLLEHIS